MGWRGGRAMWRQELDDDDDDDDEVLA